MIWTQWYILLFLPQRDNFSNLKVDSKLHFIPSYWQHLYFSDEHVKCKDNSVTWCNQYKAMWIKLLAQTCRQTLSPNSEIHIHTIHLNDMLQFVGSSVLVILCTPLTIINKTVNTRKCYHMILTNSQTFTNNGKQKHDCCARSQVL